jgi:hypothetical protein
MGATPGDVDRGHARSRAPGAIPPARDLVPVIPESGCCARRSRFTSRSPIVRAARA